ncbi:hypothetical protein RN001_001879 [Aquatica leii]|uniref:Uncharacterized protein n=1 Tax=Aquatica leii TaxID=1421715 RepID=A0AAN7PGN6_9COLE|nr:hypothetical protein RN001_001879 [Aquatica leii]
MLFLCYKFELFFFFPVIEVHGDANYFLENRSKVISVYINECMCATGVNNVMVQKWRDRGEFTNDPCFKCFVRCVAIKVGFVDSMGSFSCNTMIKKLEVTPEIVNKCVGDNNKVVDLCEQVYKIEFCIVNAMCK